jgi:hypothetical protein
VSAPTSPFRLPHALFIAQLVRNIDQRLQCDAHNLPVMRTARGHQCSPRFASASPLRSTLRVPLLIANTERRPCQSLHAVAATRLRPSTVIGESLLSGFRAAGEDRRCVDDRGQTSCRRSWPYLVIASVVLRTSQRQHLRLPYSACFASTTSSSRRMSSQTSFSSCDCLLYGTR